MDGRERLSRLFLIVFIACGLITAFILWLQVQTYTGVDPTPKPPKSDIASKLLPISALGAAGSFLGLIIVQLEIWSYWLRQGRHSGEKLPDPVPMLLAGCVLAICVIAWFATDTYFYFEVSPVVVKPSK
jgi:hypothetical protein